MAKKKINAKKALSADVATKFFGSLYEERQELPTEEYDALVSRLVARIGSNVVAGDQALQSLMVNFVMSNAKDITQVHRLGAALGGIKQRAVEEVISAFPNANLDQLLTSARESGYDVQVLR
jgi:hypothetical protein